MPSLNTCMTWPVRALVGCGKLLAPNCVHALCVSVCAEQAVVATFCMHAASRRPITVSLIDAMEAAFASISATIDTTTTTNNNNNNNNNSGSADNADAF